VSIKIYFIYVNMQYVCICFSNQSNAMQRQKVLHFTYLPIYIFGIDFYAKSMLKE